VKDRSAQSVDDYIAGQPSAVRGVLERVRGAIRKALPEAEERISYSMPSYRLDGANVLNFGAWKEHYALYLATGRIVAAFEDELAPYEVKKGTILFSLTQPVPVKLIERIVKFRAAEVAARTSLRRP
jgi:uncharacterized protein YdhG (YjbR/CyaY superfamily)